MTRGYAIDDDRLDEYDEEQEDPAAAMKAKIKRELIQKLADEWNIVHSEMERQFWQSQEDKDEEAEFLVDMCAEGVNEKISQLIDSGKAPFSEEHYETYISNRFRWRDQPKQPIPEDVEHNIRELEEKFTKEFYDQENLKKQENVLRLQVIEELLAENGARMMRPYEHWNEEEKLMEYLERDRDYRDYE